MKESEATRKRRMKAATHISIAANLLYHYNQPGLGHQLDEVATGIATDPHYGKPVQ